MVKIVHYREKCIGCNSCVEYAPDFWKMDKKDGKSNLVGSTDKKGVSVLDISLVDVEVNKKAAKSCPVNIIRVV